MRLLWLLLACLAQSSALLSSVGRYEEVTPRRLPGRRRRSQQEQDHPDHVEYTLDIEGNTLLVHLEKNRSLLGSNFTETHYSEDGGRVTSTQQDHCYYHGHVDGTEDSAVSVGLCSGISGFVRVSKQVYFIEPLGQTDTDLHAVFRPEDLKVSAGQSGSSGARTRYDLEQGHRLAALFRSRSWKSKLVADQQRFVELVVVVDNAEYKRYGQQTKPRILSVVNHVDKLYRPLNIRVVLVGLEIWSDKDHMDVNYNSETTLDNFLLWRQTELLRRTKHDNAQFVTAKDFEGDTVGLANKFAMCTENSGGVNQDHHVSPVGLASTIAHEIGHNFGLSHDTGSCECASSSGPGNCVMADKLRTGNQAFPELFSSCSIAQLAEFLERAQPDCLHKPGSTRNIDPGPRCGNAILDDGEECDCGTPEECDNPCCEASSCRLTVGAQCAHGHCCDNCQFKEAGSLCRKAVNDCDLPEFCSGASSECPQDSYVMNGKPCFQRAEGFCYNGQCPTHQQHCWRLFGEGAKVGHGACFELNRRGEEGANCGRSQLGFISCSQSNLKCGSIFCEGGGESITGKQAIYKVYSIECKLAVDEDKTRRLDVVPTGAKCGDNKVCVNNRCVDVSAYGPDDHCASKCNNHGVCNHKRECHCDPGWAPPHCSTQYGDPNQGQSEVIAGVCASLSILLVITVVLVGLMCSQRSKVDSLTSRRKAHYSRGKLSPRLKEESSTKPRPEISLPTFMTTTASQACTPLMANTRRPAPPPPVKTTTATLSVTTEELQMKPQPPAKPLPPFSQTLVSFLLHINSSAYNLYPALSVEYGGGSSCDSEVTSYTPSLDVCVSPP
ncbi:zinc metalloproteinase-disintegrin-like jararhagin isoform 1-T1 [Synchiropus picturatus]